jgi:hypothetical protein
MGGSHQPVMTLEEDDVEICYQATRKSGLENWINLNSAQISESSIYMFLVGCCPLSLVSTIEELLERKK